MLVFDSTCLVLLYFVIIFTEIRIDCFEPLREPCRNSILVPFSIRLIAVIIATIVTLCTEAGGGSYFLGGN